MNPAIVMIIGLSVTCIILWLISQSLDRSQDILKLFIIMSIFALMLLMPKVFSDSSTICETVVSNSTYVGNFTSYEYKSFCFVQDTGTSKTFMNIIFWSYRIFIAYIITYLLYIILMALWGAKDKRN